MSSDCIDNVVSCLRFGFGTREGRNIGYRELVNVDATLSCKLDMLNIV